MLLVTFRISFKFVPLFIAEILLQTLMKMLTDRQTDGHHHSIVPITIIIYLVSNLRKRWCPSKMSTTRFDKLKVFTKAYHLITQCKINWFLHISSLYMIKFDVCLIHFRYICRKEKEIVGEVVNGAKLSIAECQYQFQNRRWNCTTARESFARILRRGRNNRFFKDSFKLRLTLNNI